MYDLLPIAGFYLQFPAGSAIIDPAGNLFGAAQSGLDSRTGGGVYELTPSSPNWIFTDLWNNTIGGGAECRHGYMVTCGNFMILDVPAPDRLRYGRESSGRVFFHADV